MTQIDLDWARRTRRMKDELDMYLEIQTFLPREDPAVFEHAVTSPKRPAHPACAWCACSAGATRCSTRSTAGRRPSTASTGRSRWPCRSSRNTGCALGIENHKDWRVDEQVALLQQYSSEYVGVTLDTGNNLSVLDDPMETVEKLAPYTFNVHFKDMAVEECERGFLMSEVPLGEGMLDMKAMVDTIRRAKPTSSSRSR